MIASGVSIHRRVLGDTDPGRDAHPFLKGSAGDLWVAPSGTPVPPRLGPPAPAQTCITHLLDISSNYSHMI